MYQTSSRISIRGRGMVSLVLVVLLSSCLTVSAAAQVIPPSASGTIHSVAGNGQAAFAGDNGSAVSGALANPFAMTADAAGNIFIADTDNHRVRRTDTAGVITTVAGNDTQGFFGDGGPATSASLNHPTGVAIDASGNLYIADSNNHRIRMVSGGVISTFAGNGIAGLSGDNGAAISASLNRPRGVAVDAAGAVYIADSNNHLVRKVSGGIITSVAGTGEQGFFGDGGPATSAALNSPSSVAVGASGRLYIADTNNHRIRLVASGTISTFAGNGTAGFSGDGGSATSAAINYPRGIALDSIGNLYIADSNNHVVRRIGASGVITTIVGNGEQGFLGEDGPLGSAGLDSPTAVLPIKRNLLIADKNNQRIRSASLIVEVLSPDYFLSANPAAVNIKAGESAQLMFTVNPVGGFNSPISFSCSDLPSYITCTFLPATITPNGGPVVSLLTINTTQLVATQRPLGRHAPSLATLYGLGSFGLAGLVLMGSTRRKVRVAARGTSFAVAICLLGIATGCGGGRGQRFVSASTGTAQITVSAQATADPQNTGGITTFNKQSMVTVTVVR